MLIGSVRHIRHVSYELNLGLGPVVPAQFERFFLLARNEYFFWTTMIST